MGRPKKFNDAQRVYVESRAPRHRLQEASERRAIVNLVIDNGGAMTMGEIDDHFGYDTQSKVAGLVNAGWLAFDSGAE